MKQFALILGLLVILGVGVGVIYWLQGDTFTAAPQFSEYASTSAELLERQNREFRLVQFAAVFDVPTSTSNAYPTVRLEDEIEYLIDRLVDRSEGGEQRIEELVTDPWKISTEGGTVETLVSPTTKPYTRSLLEAMILDIEKIIATEQVRFDIARPMQVDLRVNSPIATPDSPSYPSELAAELQIMRRLFEELNYQDETFSEAVKIAIDELYIYGLNTRLDVYYAITIADTYFEKVINTYPNSTELFQLLSEREWQETRTVPVPDGPLPDILVVDQNAEAVPQGILFKANVANKGSASTAESYPVQLQVDIYSDGTVDIIEDFDAVQLYSDTAVEVSYFTTINRAGEHLFRFVLDPEWVVDEKDKLNNYGKWINLTR